MERNRETELGATQSKGCLYEPHGLAKAIAAYLDARQVERANAEEREKNEAVGRYVRSWRFTLRVLRTLGLIGAPIVAWLHGAGKINFAFTLFGG